jgi:hypothetical protein
MTYFFQTQLFHYHQINSSVKESHYQSWQYNGHEIEKNQEIIFHNWYKQAFFVIFGTIVPTKQW